MRPYSRPLHCLLGGASLSLLLGATLGATPKVVVISLDGGTPRYVEQYLKDGSLPADQGIGLLKSRGISALQNQTVSPSLTAVGHIAITTGSTGARNDIAANAFHLLASPFLTTISGFGAPIGGYSINTPNAPSPATQLTAEPIWVSLRAAGKKVVAATFPGADGVDIIVPGATATTVQPRALRTVDYTVPFGEFNGLGGKGFTLGAADFAVASAATVNALAAAGHPSFGPVRQAALETFTADGGSYNIQVAALDTTNDGVTNYDTLVFFDASHGGITAGPFPLPATGPAYVKLGGPSQRFYLEGSTRKSGTAYFVTVLAPDLSTVHLTRYSGYDIPRTSADPNVIANVDDINNNVGFWGAQPDFRYPERLNPGIANFSDAELEAIYQDQVNTWVPYQTQVALRAITANPNADLVFVYSEQPDGSEHQFLLVDPRQPTNPTDNTSIGSNQDPVKKARYANYVTRAYQAANSLVQSVINTVGVDAATGRPNSNIIVVSDHGFDPFHTSVNLTNLLNSAGLPNAQVRAVTSGPAANVYINLQGREVAGTTTQVTPTDYVRLQRQVASALRNLVDVNPNYTAGASSVPVFDKVYTRPLTADLNDPTFGRKTSFYVGQDYGDVYALLTSGYNFDGAQSPVVPRLGDAFSSAPVLSVPNFYGAHGYDPTLVDMSAIFYAAGPDITPNATPLAAVRNIDIAPTVARLLGVTPSALVQGSALPVGPAPLQLLAAASRKEHGAASVFDLPLPVKGSPGVECRRAGTGGTHTLVFTFSNPLTAGSAALTSGSGSVYSTSISGRQLLVNLVNVADIQTLTLQLNGVTSGTQSLPNTPLVSVAFLLGDVNGDRTVDATDLNQVRTDAADTSANTVITSANFRSDVVANGAINSADAAITNSALGHRLPNP